MTLLRKRAFEELEKLPEDKVSFILQILQYVNELSDNTEDKRTAFAKLEKLCVKGAITNDSAELALYRDEKYGK